ncbi:3282_t:CDS:2, partial [Ambispora leptoticha]
MAFGQVELAHHTTQTSSNQTQISTPVVVSPMVSGPGRPAQRFQDIPRTHSAPSQTNNNDSNQTKMNNHQIQQQTQSVGHTQPVVHPQPGGHQQPTAAHTTGNPTPTVINNAHQVNSHQQISSIATNHTSNINTTSITTNNMLSNTTPAHNITTTRQPIHTGHELPHHRKDSVSSNDG